MKNPLAREDFSILVILGLAPTPIFDSLQTHLWRNQKIGVGACFLF